MVAQAKLHIGILIVISIYFIVAIFMSIRVPLHLGSDESAHFLFARFLRVNGYLPLSQEDRIEAGYKSDQPPLYPALVALAYSWGNIDSPVIKFVENHPRRQLSVIADDFVGWQQALNTEDPWQGEVLFWRVGRFVSIFFAGATLFVIYIIGLVVFSAYPRRQLLALSAVMSVAFIPDGFVSVGCCLHCAPT